MPNRKLHHLHINRLSQAERHLDTLLRKFPNPFDRRRKRAPTWLRASVLLTLPGLLSLALVFDPTLAGTFLGAIPWFGLAAILGSLLAVSRGVRIADKFALLLGACFVLSASLVLPNWNTGNLQSPYIAAITLYGSCLAIYTICAAGIYALIINLQQPAPRRYHLIRAS